MKDRAIQLIDSNDAGRVLDLKINVVRGSDGKILSGVTIGNTLEQNKALILLAQAGDLKFEPMLGVGIENLLLDDNLLAFRHKIREEFAKDGLKVKTLNLYNINNIEIDANY